MISFVYHGTIVAGKPAGHNKRMLRVGDKMYHTPHMRDVVVHKQPATVMPLRDFINWLGGSVVFAARTLGLHHTKISYTVNSGRDAIVIAGKLYAAPKCNLYAADDTPRNRKKRRYGDLWFDGNVLRQKEGTYAPLSAVMELAGSLSETARMLGVSRYALHDAENSVVYRGWLYKRVR